MNNLVTNGGNLMVKFHQNDGEIYLQILNLN